MRRVLLQVQWNNTMCHVAVRGRLLLLAAVLVPCVVAAGNTPEPAAVPHHDNPADVKAVLATVNDLFAAFETGDAAAMLRLVYADGRVTASGLRGDGASNLRQQTWTVFAGRIKPDAASRSASPIRRYISMAVSRWCGRRLSFASAAR